MRYRNIHMAVVAAVMSLLATGCTDDMIDPGFRDEYPEGDVRVSFAMDLEPFTESSAGTRSLGGKSMDRLDDLCLIAYDREGNLMEGFPMEITKENNSLNVTTADRTDKDAAGYTEGGTIHAAESTTKHATFNAVIPYGNYYLYGVANLGKRDKDGNIIQSTYAALCDVSGQLHEDIRTRQTFLDHRREWDEDNGLNNFEMLGNFTNSEHSAPPVTGENMNEVRVSVERPGMTLHTWLRRCVSKVTVDFDGSGLRENIKVYVKRATIHDIPTGVKLGHKSAVTSEKEMHTYKTSDYRPDKTSKGDDIEFGVGDDHRNWPFVAKGHPKLVIANTTPDFQGDGLTPDFHSESAPSMFLYENMQGDSMEDKTNKEQKPAADGTVIGTDEKKDEMPYGSYVEVEAYYEHNSRAEVTEGVIIYRFMLGKDVLKNFDVERNYHLKLTLCLRGNGNDVDWHIEYNRPERFEYKDPYYVSYLYDHDSTIHFRYTPPAGRKVKKLVAEIVGNNWWPEDAGTQYFTKAMEKQSPFSPEERKLNDLTQASFKHNEYTEGPLSEKNKDYPDIIGPKTKYLGNGFLSLRETSQHVLTFEDNDEKKAGDWSREEWTSYMNDKYFYGISKSSGGIDRSYRVFDIENFKNDSANINKTREAYSVEPAGNNSLRINIPVFTRAKNIVKEAAFTGQNVYDGSHRYAYVRFTVILDNGEKDWKVMRVEQVRRVPNPKGIYRSSGKNDNFSVTLMNLPNARAEEFIPLESDGPWMAEVLGEKNFINLNGRTTISGSTGSIVSFNVRFNKMNRDNKVRNAIVRVRYNNYTCVHLIFVRQGYDAVPISPEGTKWETRNFLLSNMLVSDPRDEGSMFKYGNITEPIDACNNEPTWRYNELPTDADFSRAKALRIAEATEKGGWKNTTTKAWKDIKGDMGNRAAFESMNIPTVKQFRSLICSKNDYDSKADNVNKQMSHGFGVLYADGANSVKTKVAEAYGYKRDGDQSYGMRGVFVYYYNNNDVKDFYNCKNIFFPIGRSGHGQRRANDKFSGSKNGSNDGTLRYCAGQYTEREETQSYNMPFFYDLWRRPGAIYWAVDEAWDVSDVTDAFPNATDPGWMAFDLNYYTLDVNLLQRSNMQKHSQWGKCEHPECINACFLRGVK